MVFPKRINNIHKGTQPEWSRVSVSRSGSPFNPSLDRKSHLRDTSVRAPTVTMAVGGWGVDLNWRSIDLLHWRWEGGRIPRVLKEKVWRVTEISQMHGK